MKQHYTRLAEVSIAEMLPILEPHLYTGTNSTVKGIVGGHEVKLNSIRLQNFARGTKCSCCGLEATHFAVEYQTNNKQKQIHINLWARVGDEETLFTHDHTKAKSNGGANNLINTTTMCQPCNNKKANS